MPIIVNKNSKTSKVTARSPSEEKYLAFKNESVDTMKFRNAQLKNQAN